MGTTTSSTAGRSVSSCSLRASPFFRGPDWVVDMEGTTSIRLTNTGPFIEDENEPDIIRRIAGRQISWLTLHEVGVSATGT